MLLCRVIRILWTRGIPRLFCISIRPHILLKLVTIVYANSSPVSLSSSSQSGLRDANRHLREQINLSKKMDELVVFSITSFILLCHHLTNVWFIPKKKSMVWKWEILWNRIQDLSEWRKKNIPTSSICHLNVTKHS